MWAFIYNPLLYCYIIFVTPTANKHVNAAFHPIHVSTTNISFNQQEKKMEVICTIFTDDFEAALAKQYHTKSDLSKQEMHAAMDIIVKNYLAGHLKIAIGAKPINLHYLGFEINREATDVYIESDKLPEFKKIDADVSILHNLFTDQINIVHMTVNGVRKSEKLDYPDRKISQTF